MKTSISSTCFCSYNKHPNSDNNIRPVLSSACFQYSFLMTDSLYLSWRNMNEHYYLTSTKSVIWQIDSNCSPFQSLNMLPFHITLERLKLIYYGLTPNISKYYFKTGTICLLFVYSHVFTALELENNHFGILP